MYGVKTKYKGSLKWLFGTLRFLTLFLILLLLINPKFVADTYSIVKPKLSVIVDNSLSISELGQVDNTKKIISTLQENTKLNDKFNLSFFSFGSALSDTDSLTFSKRNTNISKALSSVDELFKNEMAPSIIITDGNQTLGNDYEFYSAKSKNAVFPVILGDTVIHKDLKIELLNTNRYAFLKNKFPVEAVLVYNGVSSVSSQFIVKLGSSVVYKENVSFSASENTRTISFTLPATQVGLQKYNVEIRPLKDEKNTINNVKRFVVEVIDQATKVLIVSKILHPDLGAFKKSISSNEQRNTTFKDPNEAISVLNDYQLILLYQPDRSFRRLYLEIDKLKKNTLVITGLQTDWAFLNGIQKEYRKNIINQSEYVSGSLHPAYSTFAVEDIGFDDLKPLRTFFGDLELLVPHEVLLDQYIGGIASESPMLVTMEVDGTRHALWDGEDLWKWRAQTYVDTDSFEEFDNFFGKIIQYLASNKRRSRLEVTTNSFYYNNGAVYVSAQYFDQNFVFDSRASLSITVTNTESNNKVSLPMLLKNNFYEIDLNTLPAGAYTYSVAVADQTVRRSGNFTILDFNVEQQFLNAEATKLKKLAANTDGRAFFISEIEIMIDVLLNDNRYQQVQKREQKVVPLIDWKYLLGLIILILSAEWFIRKYNGLT